MPVNSNSFINNNHIFQILTNNTEIKLSIKDFNNSLIKEHSCRIPDEIDFNNFDFCQDNGNTKERKIIKKTDEFLKNINNSNVAIISNFQNEKYFLQSEVIQN